MTAVGKEKSYDRKSRRERKSFGTEDEDEDELGDTVGERPISDKDEEKVDRKEDRRG